MIAPERASVTLEPQCGYRRLDPLPTNEELEVYYAEQYTRLVRRGDRAPDLRRLLENGPEAQREREWMAATLYADVRDLVAEAAPGRRILEVGCGTGDLLCHLRDHGFDVTGVEPSIESSARAREQGLAIRTGTLEDIAPVDRYDAIVMINVLEHVRNPEELLRAAAERLSLRGLLILRVPNDFSRLQQWAQEKAGGDPWWIRIPDHVNYFDFISLSRLLRKVGFEVTLRRGDFPMEIFLLDGLDYVAHAAVGAACHAARIGFERALPQPVRRAFYDALAVCGIGRTCFLAAEKKADGS